jgi:hypothetical protein
MNSESEPAITPRWIQEATDGAQPTTHERAVLRDVLTALRQVRHGSVTLAIQDSRVVQIDVTEKRRL